ncbi:type II and III secretion system protein [Massilia violaceinigra]|uniref:Type II and III secretion system protein n=1 Tax=Massilia violaceinigra TaxID=2045208 RepID=A0A2D2DR96_9BURK|nr:pilus (MSHA type) biogenesis protein MshL [Massilia violaceinigra]ATQ77502.1 type II and III secretion system protein [Massilia violaceinigra]
MTLTKSVSPWSTAGTAICCALLSACATPTLPRSPSHVTQAPPAAGRIPDPVMHSAPLPPPKATPKAETYSVTVHKVPVQSLLFALARDARLNVDIHPGIEGTVTLNALDQTLPQLLTRISRQVDMRYEIDGATLTVLPDTPVWRNYKVDYVNMARSTSSSVNIATQISTTGGGSSTPTLTNANGSTSGGAAAAGGSGNNNSTTSVTNRSENNFWGSLEKNIRDMLRETTLGDAPSTISSAAPPPAPGAAQPQPGQPAQPTPPAVPDNVLAAFNASSSERQRNAPSVIVNAEGGLLAVRATGRQHEKIQQFLDIVLGSAKRQVLIEATIIEVRLSDQYQQGINWSRLHGGLTLTQKPVGGTLPGSNVAIGTTPGLFSINYINPTSALGNITTAIQLLESFGKVKVLSSPKISVLNNQTAMLKVVDNNVFFTIKVTPAVIGVNGNVTTPATYESKLETVPVGFVMSVTPQIADSDEVTLNVRPTITRIVGYVTDPNPALAAENVISQVPVIQAREVESILKVYSGDISVLGGLMQDSVDNAKDAVPGAGVLPVIGNFFSYRNEKVSKTELVIFIRPVVVKNASINGDYKDYRYLLPDTSGAVSEPYSEPVRGKVN